MVQQLGDTYPGRFAPITLQVNGDPFTVPWSQDRLDLFYGLTAAVPTFMVDALINSRPGDYISDVEQRMGQPTDVTLELTGDPVGGSTWDITAQVCLEGGGSRPVRVFVAPTLDHHPDLQSYATNVLMQKVFETNVTLNGGGCSSVTDRIDFDPLSMANSSDIVVVAWVQDPASSIPATIYQAGLMRWPFPSGSQLAAIDVTPLDATLNVGDEVVFTATGRDQHGAPFPLSAPVWSFGVGDGTGSLDPTTGTTTTFTATAPGTRQILCTENGVTGGAVVTVRGTAELATIEVDPASATVEVGGEIAFTATGKDQYGEDFELDSPTWAIAGDGDGTFDPASGAATTLTGTYPGAATVTCSQGGVSGTAAVEVTGDDPQLTTITVQPPTAELRVGAELELEAVGADQYGRPFEIDFPGWFADGDGDGTFDPVDETATTFTATAPGSAQLVCLAGCGVQGSAEVEITAGDLPAPRRATRRVVPD
ncbi:MAG: hypothetical protein V2I67_19155 [Thermoanaerobaculales bacterium]|nr:hypothetical protein [Thermoanaerobaculales bacterium]